MSRSRPTIDVSSHLIEPGPADAAVAATAVNWVALFGDDHPVELEVGSGKGLFLANAARANPGRNFLGVEISRKYARLAAERLAKQGIANARVWAGDARDVLAPGPGSEPRAVHVYFPDPWWKKRHKKRRVFNETLLAEIERTLKPGGELHVASDVEEYFACDPRADRREPPISAASVARGEGPRAQPRLSDQLRAEVPPGRAADLSGDLRDRLSESSGPHETATIPAACGR